MSGYTPDQQSFYATYQPTNVGYSVPQQAPPTLDDAYAVASMHSYPAMYAEVVDDVRAGHFEPNYDDE